MILVTTPGKVGREAARLLAETHTIDLGVCARSHGGRELVQGCGRDWWQMRRGRVADPYLDLAGVVAIAVVVGVVTDGRRSEDHEGARYRWASLPGECGDHSQHVASGRKGVAV
jgi:hypothetical protein